MSGDKSMIVLLLVVALNLTLTPVDNLYRCMRRGVVAKICHRFYVWGDATSELNNGTFIIKRNPH